MASCRPCLLGRCRDGVCDEAAARDKGNPPAIRETSNPLAFRGYSPNLAAPSFRPSGTESPSNSPEGRSPSPAGGDSPPAVRRDAEGARGWRAGASVTSAHLSNDSGHPRSKSIAGMAGSEKNDREGGQGRVCRHRKPVLDVPSVSRSTDSGRPRAMSCLEFRGFTLGKRAEIDHVAQSGAAVHTAFRMDYSGSRPCCARKR